MPSNSAASLNDIQNAYDELLPLKSDQQLVFGQLLRAIDYVESLGSAAWSVTLLDNDFRLNVGQVEAMTFKPAVWDSATTGQAEDSTFIGIRILLAGRDCVDKLPKNSESGEIDKMSYASVWEPHWCYTGSCQASVNNQPDPSIEPLAKELELLWANHQKYLKIACHTSTGKLRQTSNFARTHCPALYEYAKQVVAGNTGTESEKRSAALIELKDGRGEIVHDKFQAWRRKNPEGLFLNVETRNKAMAHGAGCLHLGATDWKAEKSGANSLTKRLKVLGAGGGTLNQWAHANAVQISLCKDCVAQGLIPESFSDERAEGGSSEISEAMEGYAREATYMVSSRNSALRAKALERAKGCCEGCGVDFNKLGKGLGLRALQVHHREQLALRDTPSVTKLDDLAVLCANCHSMVHADVRQALSVDELKKRLQQ